MSDRVTYRDMAIMEEVLDQGDKQVCWAISLTRQLAALLKLRGQLNINARLSIQYLINKVGRSLFGAQTPRPWSGSVRSFETAIPFLVNGTVLENLVPLRNFDLQSSTPENHVLGERRYRAVRIVVHRINEYPGVSLVMDPSHQRVEQSQVTLPRDDDNEVEDRGVAAEEFHWEEVYGGGGLVDESEKSDGGRR
ncbi:hypothetical protein YC2023_093008 [Brassica napus]